MTSRSRQRGVVLVLVLLVIVLATVAFAGMARHSAHLALEAQDASDQLQRRWADKSIGAFYTSRAERLLSAAEKEFEVPLYRLDWHVPLNGRMTQIILMDEQAKLNVNFLYQTAGRDETASTLRQVADDLNTRELRIHLRPMTRLVTGLPSPFGSFDQIFEAGSFDLIGLSREPSIADRVTCWGDGKLHLHRSSDKVLREVLTRVGGVGVAERLITLRRDQPQLTLSDLPKHLEPLLPGNKRALIGQLLTERSRCHSLWIITEGTQRPHYTLLVRNPVGVRGQAMARFEW